MHGTCMPTKTISLSLPAYERLCHARSRPDESFSEVVLRAKWPGNTVTGGELLTLLKERRATYSAKELEDVVKTKRRDKPPVDKWKQP
jgi:predicted CopG family antitoxin